MIIIWGVLAVYFGIGLGIAYFMYFKATDSGYLLFEVFALLLMIFFWLPVLGIMVLIYPDMLRDAMDKSKTT